MLHYFLRFIGREHNSDPSHRCVRLWDKDQTNKLTRTDTALFENTINFDFNSNRHDRFYNAEMINAESLSRWQNIIDLRLRNDVA